MLSVNGLTGAVVLSFDPAGTAASASAAAVAAHNADTANSHLSAAQKTALTTGVSADAQHYHGKTVYSVRNETGTSIPALRAVYVSGFNNVPLVALADNTDVLKHHPIGVTSAAIANQANGTIVTNGLLTGVDTNAWNVGDKLWLSTGGTLVTVEPVSGEIIFLGEVVVKQNSGSILLYPDRGTDYVASASGQNIHVRLGDSAGATKVRFEDYSDTEVASLDSDGNLSIKGLTVNGVPYAPGGGGSATLTQLEIDFGSTPISDKVFTITDPGILVTSKVIVSVAYEDTTDNTADESMELSVSAGKPVAGSCSLLGYSPNSLLRGKYKINYVIG